MNVVLLVLVVSFSFVVNAATPSQVAKRIAKEESQYIPMIFKDQGMTMFYVSSSRDTIYHYVRVDNFILDENIKKYYPDHGLKVSQLDATIQGMSVATDACKLSHWRKEVLDEGVRMSYLYYDDSKPAGDFIAEYSFSEKDCADIDQRIKSSINQLRSMEKEFRLKTPSKFKSGRHNWND